MIGIVALAAVVVAFLAAFVFAFLAIGNTANRRWIPAAKMFGVVAISASVAAVAADVGVRYGNWNEVIARHAAQAAPTFLTLHFLTDGNYRFDAGPELTTHELETEVRRMADRHDCPNVHLAPDKHAPHDRVASALTIFQRYGCNDLGFLGDQKSN